VYVKLGAEAGGLALFGKQAKTQSEEGLPKQRMSLGELQAAVEGTTMLSKEGLQHFQQTFMKLATSMQNPKIKATLALFANLRNQSQPLRSTASPR